MKASFDSDQRRTIREVLDWYEFQVEILDGEKVRTLSAVQAVMVPLGSRFFGQTRDEVENTFESQRNELDAATMLFLMAAVEAEIRMDYWEKVEHRWKDPVARKFKLIDKRLRKDGMEKRVSLQEDILDTWIELRHEARRAAGDFKGALKLRDWLAHGRYWNPKLGRAHYSPYDIYDISRDLLKAIGL
jgi:hypothetical protein